MTTAGNWAFSYDANGNQTERYTSTVLDRDIDYDGDNRPVSVTMPSGGTVMLAGALGVVVRVWVACQIVGNSNLATRAHRVI